MAKEAEKTRKKGLGGGPLAAPDPLSKAINKQAHRLDTAIEKRGGFLESDLAEAQRTAEKAEKQQKEGIRRQTQQEQLRLAEAESEVQKRRFLKRAGGRRSLIASR